MGSDLHLLFVYGTLRLGCWNHYLLGGSELVGEGLVRGFTLVTDGLIPFAVRAPGECVVYGEVYRVSGEVLRRVDELEGHPVAYRRETVMVELDDGSSVEAFMYVWPGEAEECVMDEFLC